MIPSAHRISRELWNSLFPTSRYVARGKLLSIKHSAHTTITIGLIVPKKHVKSSVMRHQLRRAIYDYTFSHIPHNGAYFISIHAKATQSDYVAELTDLIAQV
jgi:ribonuclease P protein component